jgi:uncharacterized membrane protein
MTCSLFHGLRLIKSERDEYRVVLFSDIGSDTLLLHPDTFIRAQVLPNCLRLIRELVDQGGGFAMIGGYMSSAGFEGRAHCHGTPIEEILPVEIAPNVSHPILLGLEDSWPATTWVQSTQSEN